MRTVLIAVTLLPAMAAAEPTVEVTPATVKLGSGARARVRLSDGGAARWTSSIGRVVDGELELGPRRAPGYAVVAGVAGEARAATVVRLVGRGTLPTHTARGARVTVEIAGARFGPVTADAQGNADVPVEVPPEITQAMVLASDPDGLTTVKVVDLPSAPPVRGLLVAPETLPPGGRGLLTVFAVDADGAWRGEEGPPPEVTIDGGLVLERPFAPVAPGRWDAPVRAETVMRETVASLRASVDGAQLSVVTVTVTAPPPRVVAPPLEMGTRWLVGARAGAASALGPWTSGAVAAELLLARGGIFAGGVELGVARGDADGVMVTQLLGAATARLRLPVARTVVLELLAGLGAGHASTEMGSAWSMYLCAGAGAAAALGPGEVVGELRWADLHYDDVAIGVGGNALGAVLTAGYRVRL